MYGHSMYPRVGGQTQTHGSGAFASPAPRPSAYHHPAPPPPSSPYGLGIRVSMKPVYRITPPISRSLGDIPRSNFQFDFDFEKKVLAEAEKESLNWNKLAAEIVPARTLEPITPPSVQEFTGGYNLLREMGFSS